MEKLLTELTNRLTKTFSTRLVSVVLYGSAATGEHDKASDINTLCVLTEDFALFDSIMTDGGVDEAKVDAAIAKAGLR